MKIAVVGLWHLGSVMSACLAQAGHEVIAYDPDVEIRNNFQKAKAPIFEPQLDALLQNTLQSGSLTVVQEMADLQKAEVVWITFDTPVDESDIADVAFVQKNIEAIAPYIDAKALLLVSSQLPVGTTRALKNYLPNKNITVGYIPENLRLGKAIEVFTRPDRFVVGLETENDREKVAEIFRPLTTNLIWMSIESAEMTKHALNAFLATSIVFINEIATLCEQVGANATEVERGLKSEERIGPKAYLRAGEAIAGGTLLRDVNFLNKIAKEKNISAHLMSAVIDSNHNHKAWLLNKVQHVLPDLKNKVIAILGLTYKPNTNTLRRSTAVDIALRLNEMGAKIKAYDPMIQVLPENLSSAIELSSSIKNVLHEADALILATAWPEFQDADMSMWLDNMNDVRIFDPCHFLASVLNHSQLNQYYTIGKSL
ncbi:MAG: nucleotide sugar dehydrogenase [Gammaproteobacteria bacterium]|nr:nucleotide sugar dehydrogenase [Gammaproteobacteria bacterium]